jgi:hypothetical protein
MKLSCLNEEANTTLYVGNNSANSVIIPGFCSIHLVQALWYSSPYVHKFSANPKPVDKEFINMALHGHAKDLDIPTEGVIHQSGEAIVNTPVNTVIMKPDEILHELKSGKHDLSVRGFYREVSWYGILEYGESRFGDLFPEFVRFAADNDLIDTDEYP